jgi:hypothetical protein
MNDGNLRDVFGDEIVEKEVHLVDVPAYLRSSKLFELLTQHSVNTFPMCKVRMKSNLNMVSQEDVLSLLLTIQCWNAEVPDELRELVFSGSAICTPNLLSFLPAEDSQEVQILFRIAQHKPKDRLYASACFGQLPTKKFLRRSGSTWNNRECCAAAHHGILLCLQYARKHGCPWTDGCPTSECACRFAARAGHLECLQFAHQNGCPQHCEFLVGDVAWNMECLEYVLNNNFPIATTYSMSITVLQELEQQARCARSHSCLVAVQRRRAAQRPPSSFRSPVKAPLFGAYSPLKSSPSSSVPPQTVLSGVGEWGRCVRTMGTEFEAEAGSDDLQHLRGLQHLEQQHRHLHRRRQPPVRSHAEVGRQRYGGYSQSPQLEEPSLQVQQELLPRLVPQILTQPRSLPQYVPAQPQGFQQPSPQQQPQPHRRHEQGPTSWYRCTPKYPTTPKATPEKKDDEQELWATWKNK